MKQSYFVVNAFTRDAFGGNPAGVCPLVAWLPDELMQRIATENGLSETAFFVAAGGHHELRWFTPAVEVKLCGHATLASSHVLYTHLGAQAESLEFRTLSGPLFVSRDGATGRYILDLPAQPGLPAAAPAGLVAALGVEPVELIRSDDLLVVLESADQVAALAEIGSAFARIAGLVPRFVPILGARISLRLVDYGLFAAGLAAVGIALAREFAPKFFRNLRSGLGR